MRAFISQVLHNYRWQIFLGVAAAAFRIPFITQESVTVDADATRIISSMPVGEMLAAYPQLEPHPPLYYVFVHYSIVVFGNTHFGLRLPTLLAGILTPPLLYLAMRPVTTRWTAFLGGSIAVVSQYLVFWSQYARMYMLLGMFVTLSYYFFTNIVVNGWTWTRGAGYILAAVLAMYTHLFAGPSLFAQAALVGLALIERVPFETPDLRKWISVYGVIGTACLPLSWGVYRRLQIGQTYGATKPISLTNVFRTLGEFLGLGQWPNRYIYGVVLGSLAVSLSMRAIIKRSNPDSIVGYRPDFDSSSIWLLGSWIAGPFIVIYGYSAVMPSATFHRYFIVSAIGIYGLFAVGIGRLQSKRVASVVTVLLLLGFASTSGIALVSVTQPDWQSGTAYIDEHAQSDDLVISGNPQSPDEFAYYSDRTDLRRAKISFNPTKTGVCGSVGSADRVWLIGFSGRVNTIRDILQESFKTNTHREFHRLDVYLFTAQRGGCI